MKVVQVSFSSSGGAGNVARLLKLELENLGHDSKLLVVTDNNLRSEPLRNPILTTRALLDRFIVSKRHALALFSLHRARSRNRLFAKKIIQMKADVLHIHWNTGVIPFDDIRKIVDAGVKVVWTFHDMEPFTGGCHHAFECLGYQSKCSNCPVVYRHSQTQVEKNLDSKKKWFEILGNKVQYTVPSDWMMTRASKSSAMVGRRLEVVPNPIGNEFFQRLNDNSALPFASNGTIVGVIVAADLSDPIKDVNTAIEAIRTAAAKSSSQIKVVLVGKDSQQKFANPSSDILLMGELTKNQIAELLIHADFYISTSLAESFSLTTAEAIAAGTFVIVRGGTAAQELISQQSIGAKFDNFSDLVEIISKIVSLPKEKTISIAHNSQILTSRQVALRFLSIYQR